MNNDEFTRRDFVSMTVGAGIAAAAAAEASAQQQVVETNVTIKTPDGTCDAAFIHPAAGSHPGVLIWTDAFGLRPSMRDIARRLAASGYSVLVPNPFYRVAKAPVFESASNFNFGDTAQRAKLTPLMGSINAAGAAKRDAAAFIAWLDTQRQVDRTPSAHRRNRWAARPRSTRAPPPAAPLAVLDLLRAPMIARPNT
jgi:carboxymethylenebutenolidase